MRKENPGIDQHSLSLGPNLTFQKHLVNECKNPNFIELPIASIFFSQTQVHIYKAYNEAI